MLNTRKNYVSLYSQAPLPRHNNKKRREKKLFYTRKNGFERNSTRKLCVPKNHLHHINCISSTPPPAPSHPKKLFSPLRTGKTESFAQPFRFILMAPKHEKSCVYNEVEEESCRVYKFRCNYESRNLLSFGKVDHWCSSRVSFPALPLDESWLAFVLTAQGENSREKANSWDSFKDLS